MAEPIDLDSIVRGDYELIDVVVENPPDATHDDYWARNITTDEVKFIAKFRLNDESALFTKTTIENGGITKTDPANGKARIELTGDETGAVSRNATLRCILEVRDAAGRQFSTFYNLPVQWR